MDERNLICGPELFVKFSASYHIVVRSSDLTNTFNFVVINLTKY